MRCSPISHRRFAASSRKLAKQLRSVTGLARAAPRKKPKSFPRNWPALSDGISQLSLIFASRNSPLQDLGVFDACFVLILCSSEPLRTFVVLSCCFAASFDEAHRTQSLPVEFDAAFGDPLAHETRGDWSEQHSASEMSSGDHQSVDVGRSENRQVVG